jgi:uncharacterized delta-60 repeat protein
MFTRRWVILLLPACVSAAAACSGNATTPGPDDGGSDSKAATDSGPPNDGSSDATAAPDEASQGADGSGGDGGSPTDATGEASSIADAGMEADAGPPVGCLDPSFGTQGVAAFSIPPNQFAGTANDLAFQADGKLLVAGPSWPNAVVARYNTDGSLDTSYGASGYLTLPPSDASITNFVNAIALQPDGSLLVGVEVYDTSPSSISWMLSRYDSTGSLDTGFGVGGYATAPASRLKIAAIAVRPDGHIVVAAYQNVGAGAFFVTQLDSAGALDTTFGTGGFTSTMVQGESSPAAVALQPDGKALVAGFAMASADGGPAHENPVLVRYDVDGNLDTGFGQGGSVVTDLGTDYGQTLGLAIQSTGRIVAVAQNSVGINRFYLLGYTPSGALDATFGSGGTTVTDFFGQEQPAGIALLGGDQLAVAGTLHRTTDAGYVSDIGLAVYSSAGVLESTFGDGGLLLPASPVGQVGVSASMLGLDQSGRLVMVGGGSVAPLDGGAYSRFFDLLRVGCL